MIFNIYIIYSNILLFFWFGNFNSFPSLAQSDFIWLLFVVETVSQFFLFVCVSVLNPEYVEWICVNFFEFLAASSQ